MRVGGDALRLTAQLTSITLHLPLPPQTNRSDRGLGEGIRLSVPDHHPTDVYEDQV